jgi:hypothetical protein
MKLHDKLIQIESEINRRRGWTTQGQKKWKIIKLRENRGKGPRRYYNKQLVYYVTNNQNTQVLNLPIEGRGRTGTLGIPELNG